jgi:tetratricopeptide (TPR) repeat protein
MYGAQLEDYSNSIVDCFSLQIGNLPEAESIFKKIERLMGIDENCDTLPNEILRPALLLSNRGLLLIAQGEFKKALSIFSDLVQRVPEVCIPMNNLGICYLLDGNVGQAACFLENMLIDNPVKAATCESLVFNLSSMYDLTEHTADKKRRILKCIAKVCGDDFDAESLRM